MTLVKPRSASPEEFCLWLKEKLELDGDALFGRTPYLVLYSGPVASFKKAMEALLGRPVDSNKPRGRGQAKRFTTDILDDTPIGKWLLAQDFVGYFAKVCNGDDKLIEAAEFAVWATVSEELVRHAKGKAFTAVCGAAPDRVFFKHELPQMLEETGLESVNNLPLELVRDFSVLGVKKAFFQIRKFELLSLHYQTRQEADPDKARALREKWNEQRGFFKESLKNHNAAALQLVPDEAKILRLRRRTIRSGYDFAAIKEAIIADNGPSSPLSLCAPIAALAALNSH